MAFRGRFTADAQLGRLARWLRALGFDCAYDESLPGRQQLQQSRQQGRILLTRNRVLLREQKPASAFEVRGDDPLEQLRQVVTAMALPPPVQLYTRCMLDNAELGPPLPPAQADALVPAGVRGIPGPVRQCPVCGRVYWQGSHVRRMRAALERVLPGWLPEGIG
ncbi:hypothetical protein GCM10027034_34420 [Ramlibacter solisilvae]|uniref:Mut7-C RNAse domain-containing protein n=1 Tax=Ramlibacter tataouinensis TaxID=94132 RepID=A0A127JSK9_9BURK|nr:Mut7-C RNAse domain-containing protein [Ramlibacter tataouinensis]AMO22930.1 hypothetical protein UC35_08575 [Ramlibacter tataouinensis]